MLDLSCSPDGIVGDSDVRLRKLGQRGSGKIPHDSDQSWSTAASLSYRYVCIIRGRNVGVRSSPWLFLAWPAIFFTARTRCGTTTEVIKARLLSLYSSSTADVLHNLRTWCFVNFVTLLCFLPVSEESGNIEEPDFSLVSAHFLGRRFIPSRARSSRDGDDQKEIKIEKEGEEPEDVPYHHGHPTFSNASKSNIEIIAHVNPMLAEAGESHRLIGCCYRGERPNPGTYFF